MPSGPRRTSSKVPGTRSGPGSTTRPTSLVPSTDARLTVVKLVVRLLPARPLPAASRKLPSLAPRIDAPTTWMVMRAPPGSGAVKNSQA